MQTSTLELTQRIDVVILFVDDKPENLMTEQEVTSYKGKVHWDYLERYCISQKDYQERDLESIIWKYHKK